jgi:hypothetical protein
MNPFRSLLVRSIGTPRLAVPVASLLLCVPGLANAQDVLGACASEIETYCPAVEPGHGRLAACLYAHEDKLGDACDAATGDHSDIIDATFAEVRLVAQECAGDMQRLCANGAGDARGHFSCLKANETDLSPGCAEGVNRLDLSID